MRACFVAAPAVSSVDAWLDKFLPSRVRSSSRETALLERFNKFDAALYELAVAEFARRGSPGAVVEPPPADIENVWEVRTDGLDVVE